MGITRVRSERLRDNLQLRLNYGAIFRATFRRNVAWVIICSFAGRILTHLSTRPSKRYLFHLSTLFRPRVMTCEKLAWIWTISHLFSIRRSPFFASFHAKVWAVYTNRSAFRFASLLDALTCLTTVSTVPANWLTALAGRLMFL